MYIILCSIASDSARGRERARERERVKALLGDQQVNRADHTDGFREKQRNSFLLDLASVSLRAARNPALVRLSLTVSGLL